MTVETEVIAFEELIRSVQRSIGYKRAGYRLLCERDKKDPQGRWYFQIECERPDTYTGEMGIGRGGKAYLSPHMTLGELVRKAFGLFAAYEEHECREAFTYNGRAIFGPHIDVVALHMVADDLDFRE